MNFFEYYRPGEVLDGAITIAANQLIDLGLKILPCTGKQPIEKIKRVSQLRIKPIHKANVDFYFSDATDLAILTGENSLEVIDVDAKYDLTGNMYKSLCRAIEFAQPEIWDKLVIQKSRNGGYHFFYKCGQIGGNKLLAGREAAPAEYEKGERFKTLIETKGQGGYIMCCPSAGYEFIKGNPAEIQFITPEERLELFAICQSFDKITKPALNDISTASQVKEDAPWNVFNKTHTYTYIVELLESVGWEQVKEDNEKVYLLRPGSTAKSSGSVWKESGILYLFTTSTEFKSETPYSCFGVLCQIKFSGDVRACAFDLAEKGIGKWNQQDGEFYEINARGAVIIKHKEIVDWMSDIGIKKFFTTNKDYELVHVVNNVVKIIDHNYIKKLFIDYISSTKIDSKAINSFLSSLSSIFSTEGIIHVVPKLDDNFLKSSQNESFLFFKNTVISVTNNDVKTIDYAKISGYVWEKNIIQRNYIIKNPDCFAAKFIYNVSGNRAAKGGKPENEEAFRCAIGYMLHGYKEPDNPKVIILTDEFFDEQKDTEPEGGTGKGMFIQLLDKFKNVCRIDGKMFDFEKSFVYQQVNYDTEIVAFEDVKRKFDFEKLFSVITEGWSVEKKGQAKFTIPFDRSPKIVITSNYAVKGTSASHRRRRFELEVYPHYSPSYTIKHEFGHLFFNDWDEHQFACFDCYMIECLQIYLKNGFHDLPTVNLTKKRLIEETNKDFVNWMDGLYALRMVPQGQVHKTEFLSRFVKDFPDYTKLTQAWFTKWLVKWCSFYGFTFDAAHRLNNEYAYNFTYPLVEPVTHPVRTDLPDEPPF